MKKAVVNAAMTAKSWSEFRELLAAKGIRIYFRYSRGGDIKGIIFSDGKQSYAGSKLHADCSLKKLGKEDDSVRLNATFFYILMIILFTLTAYFGITAFCNFALWHHAHLTSVFWWCTGLSLSAIGVILALKHFFTRQR